MDNNCQYVVFSDKAYNAIIRETFEWDPVETGGILLGHILENGYWIVMEVLPPGYGEGREGNNVFHETGYFEYNAKFVNYLATSVAKQYEIPLELLGLWHRHPGNMNYFSSTDDETNLKFAAQNPYGTISGLVNVDPQFKFTMYYLPHTGISNGHSGRVSYQKVDVEVGSDLIPEKYFKLRYYNGGEKDLHPYPPEPSITRRGVDKSNKQKGDIEDINDGGLDSKRIIVEQIDRNRQKNKEKQGNSTRQGMPLFAKFKIFKFFKKNKFSFVLVLASLSIVLSILSLL